MQNFSTLASKLKGEREFLTQTFIQLAYKGLLLTWVMFNKQKWIACMAMRMLKLRKKHKIKQVNCFPFLSLDFPSVWATILRKDSFVFGFQFTNRPNTCCTNSCMALDLRLIIKSIVTGLGMVYSRLNPDPILDGSGSGLVLTRTKPNPSRQIDAFPQ